ncbi:MAG: 4-hydroxy-tetrahydrodipicolinate reductase [Clostridiales bacterium]|nr:4-hydroxy-tetrahydrodipicolinate reductase [Clostridiales bacterium]
MSEVRVFLSGCMGRMGRVITEMCSEYEDTVIVAGSDVVENPNSSFPIYKDPTECKEEFDVIIDFSHVSAFAGITKLAETSGKPIVMCTTGLSEEQKADLKKLSEKVGVFYSGNMSLGINVLINLVKKAAAQLYPDFDIELVEEHHNKKLDAPSGTALMIADAMNEAVDNRLEYVYERQSKRQKREKKELGIHSIRGGNIVGEHKVMFIGGEEILTISHSAQTRNVFGRGAVAAAKYMLGKGPGMYDMQSMLG